MENSEKNDQVWIENYQRVKCFIQRFGRLPRARGNETAEEAKLGAFIHRQRQAKKNRGTWKIDQRKIVILEKLPDWRWEDDPDTHWQNKFLQLKNYLAEKKRYPKANSQEPQEKMLYNWIRNQKYAKRCRDKKVASKHYINLHRIESLESLEGWEW